jgi:hypothetical protein
MTEDPIPLSPRSRFRAALILAMAADALQIFVFPSFVEGALSPADDVLDLAVAAVLVRLLGWHWNFFQHSLLNSCPESIWFHSGRLRSPTFIANGSRSRLPQKKLVSSVRLYQSRRIIPSRKSDGGQDSGVNGDL